MKEYYTLIQHKFRSFSIILLLLFLFLQTSYSQNWEWAKHFSGTGHIRVNSHTYSVFNSSVTCIVVFAGSITIDASNFTSNGGNDILVANFSSTGNLQWISQIGSTGAESPKDVYTDELGNIFVTGSFSDVVNVDGNIIVSTGEQDAFVAKYLPGGSIDWIKNIGWGPGIDRGSNISINDAGDIYIVGFFNDTLIFGTDSLFANNYTNGFIVKLDNNGDYISSLHFSATNNNTKLNSIAIASDNGNLVSGLFLDTLIFPNNDTLFSQGNEDFVIFKLTNSDNIEWIRQVGGTGSDIGFDAKSDEYGSIYVVGQIAGTVQVDSTDKATFDASPLTTNGGIDIFTAKYNKQGRLLWKKNIGGSGTDIGLGLDHNQNLIHFGGYFTDTIIINQDTINTTGPADYDAFYAVVNTDGNYITMEQIRGDNVDRVQSAVYDNAGAEYIGGLFRSTELYVGDDTLVNANPGVRDGFLAKWQSKFSISITEKINASCNGYNDGRLVITPYFGAPPYTYDWSHDAGLNDSTANNLTAGPYKVVVTDGDLKVDSISINISQPTPITITLDSTNLSCYQSGDGAIDITVTGGTVEGDYKYNWTGGAGLNPTGSDQVNLFAGFYRVTVTDDNDCLEYDSTTIIQPNPITYAGTIVTPSNPPGSCSGSIDLELQGGTPVYSYEWAKGGVSMPGRTSDTLNNLCGDSYTVTVTDDNMCTDDTTLVVSDEDELIAFIDSLSHVTCYGYNDGYARIGISGDKGVDFSYTWEDSLRSPVGTDTNYIADMPGGLYYVTVIENGGDNRIDSTSVTIQEPTLLTSGISSISPLCFGDENGAINLTVSGGNPLYSYIWSTGQITEDLDNIPGSAEYYRVTVTDQKGCQLIDSVLLTVPEEFLVSITTLQELRCNGYTNGILQADVSGGIGTIDYLWNDQSGQTTQIATGLEAGTYIVTVTDDNSCQDTASSVLTDPEPVIISSVDSSHVSCKGLSDASIRITPSGGTAPYTYDWDRIPVDTNYVTGLSVAFGGVYSVQVSDINECPPASFEIQIKEPDIALDISEDMDSHIDNLCFGSGNGELGVTSTGGWGNHQFSFNGVDWGTTATYTGLLSGSYYTKVRDSGECYDSVLISILQPDDIGISEVAASHQNVLCYGDNTGQLEVLASGGNPDYEYSSDKVSWNVNPLFENLFATSYIIWARDANECIDSAVFSISQPDRLIIDPEVSGDTINAVATGGTPPLFYSLNSGSLQVTGLFTGLSGGEYSVSVIDGNNCSADTSVVVAVEPPPPEEEIIIYDAFSPNADGKNDVWNIGNIQSYPNCIIKIFNSWGTAVFTSDGYDEPWDGKHNNNDLPAGTYYYYIDLGNGNGTYTGTVNIVK